jgi:hypothetical protein
MYQLRFYKFPGRGRGPIASGREAIMKKPEYVPPFPGCNIWCAIAEVGKILRTRILYRMYTVTSPLHACIHTVSTCTDLSSWVLLIMSNMTTDKYIFEHWTDRLYTVGQTVVFIECYQMRRKES